MAKSKEQPTEPIEVKEEAVVEEHEDFVTRKLKVINTMQKPAKAQRLADRLLRKARN